MEKFEAAVRVVLEFIEAFNRHEIPAMLALVTASCTFESPSPAPDGSVFTGKAALTQYWRDFFFRFPQAHLTVEHVFGFGFNCVLRWKLDYVAEGGILLHQRGVDLYQVRDGLIAEMLSYTKGDLQGSDPSENK